MEKAAADAFENILSEQARLASIEKFDKAEAFLKPYSGTYLSESQAKDLIQQSGVKTFPRPSGIPENFKVKLSDRGAGMIYVHPENTHIRVRVMPGKPHSPFPYQQKPYITYKKHGKSFDKFGNVVDPASPEAYIPIDEFTYIKD